MNQRSRAALFWGAVAAQVAGAQFFFWNSLPIYQRLMAGETAVGTPKAFGQGLTSIVFMQLGYWLAYRIRPRLQFRRRTFLGHVLLCLGEISFFFVNALATVVVFDDWGKQEFVLWKLMVLVMSIFAFFCYKSQLVRLGEAMLAREDTGK